MATDKKISELTELNEAPANGDYFPIVDTSASETKKISALNAVKAHDDLATVHASATTIGGKTLPSGTIVGTSDTQTLSAKTLTTPTIASFTNATHDHSNAAGGGSVSHLNLTNIGTNSHATIDTHIAATSAHGVTGDIVGTSGTQTLFGKTLTSPTLTAPALGTPASGVLTNCTGYTEANLTTTDVTTNDASTSKHGFLKKLDNNASNFMNGQGNWAAPSGGGGITTSGLQFMGSHTLAASGQTLLVSGLDLSTHKLYFFECQYKNPTASASVGASLYVNDDLTATNYDTQSLYCQGSSVQSAHADDAIVSYANAGLNSTFWGFMGRNIAGQPYARTISNEHSSGTSDTRIRDFNWSKSAAANVTSIWIQSAVAQGLENGSTLKVWRVNTL